MKPLLYTIYLLFATSLVDAQVASRLIATQINPQGKSTNFMWLDTSLNLNRMMVVSADSAAKTIGETVAFGNSVVSAQSQPDWNSSGGKSEILNKPTIPGAQVNSDWNASSGISQILNKPSLSVVATSGAYNDLSGRPSLSAVATSGSYADLTGKPTIPTNNNQLVNGAGYLVVADIANKMNYSDTAALSSRINTKFTAPAGTTSQYIRGDGSLATLPSTGAKLFDKTGQLTASVSHFTDTFSVSTANPTISFSAYMSAQGWSSFKVKSVTGYRVGATTTNSPQVAVTTITSNSISLILNQTNASTVTILGINVLSGLPTILVPDPANVKVLVALDVW